MAQAFKLNHMLAIADGNDVIRKAIIDAMYEEDSFHAVGFDAAIKLLDVPGLKRHQTVNIHTCNGIAQASIIGKFIIVEF